jgi:hypothetical protein
MAKKAHSANKDLALSKELVRLYDEFTEFQDRCSFLCDAFACTVADNEYLDESTSNGFSYYSHWMKQQLAYFKARLKQIHESSRSESESSGS